MGFVWKLALWGRVEKGKEGRKMVKIADISHKTALGMLIGLK